ncbi:ribosome biogenesis GTPase Der [Candidatus Nitrospira bockiana]
MAPDLFTPTPPLIAIVGRPNVGKSTLFNRILGKRNAIVDDVPGVTRDRNYADGSYRGRPFRLVDTGGLDPTSTDGMLALIRQQSKIAIAEADLVICVMDGRAGLTPADHEIVELLRPITKPVFYAVNKIDTPKAEPLTADFYRLGAEHLFSISAEHGLGVDDLLEAIYPLLPASEAEEGGPPPVRVSVVGRPNVGKSTLINRILGEERVVVSDVPGTTRDPIDTEVEHEGRRYVFTDTAGIRRRGRIEHGVEHYSVSRAVTAMGRSDVAVLVLDGVEGITEQDTKIAGLILEQGRGCVLFVNKWDLRAGDVDAKTAYERELHRRLRFLTWAPVLYGSALKPDVLRRLFPEIDRVMAAFTRRVTTGALNKFVQQVIDEHPLPIRKGRPTKTVKAVFLTQVAAKPPTFAFFVGRPQDVGKTYLRYLEKRIREEYGFAGTPIRILVRQK